MMRAMEIDIAVDMSGYAGSGRRRHPRAPAGPHAGELLRLSGTMGLPYIDYIIADRVVIPEENLVHYSEQVVYLPHTYMPTDRKRPIASTKPSRVEAGMPESGFVFACHNTEHKFGPELFDVWMRLLRANAGSVLWLKSLNSSAMDNLRREAKARGVASGAAVFAPRVARIEDHLARLGLADLLSTRCHTTPTRRHATRCGRGCRY